MLKKRFALRGFTLVELMVVIAIMALLSSIVVVGLQSSRASSRDSKRITDIKNLQLALSQYYNDNGFYPVDYTLPYDSSNGVSPQTDGLKGAYLSTVPVEQSTNTKYPYVPFLKGTVGSLCTVNAPPVYYHLGAALETVHQILSDSSDVDANGGTNPGQYSSTKSGAIPPGINGSSFTACGGVDDFNGASANCDATIGGTEHCYDVFPQ